MEQQEQVNNEVSEVKAEESQQEYPPEIKAAMFLQGAIPAFRVKLEKVTGVQAKRVLEALAEAPLEKETKEFTTQEAKDLFMLGLMISNAKFILFNVALRDKEITDVVEAQAKEAGEEAAKMEETKGEESNG